MVLIQNLCKPFDSNRAFFNVLKTSILLVIMSITFTSNALILKKNRSIDSTLGCLLGKGGGAEKKCEREHLEDSCFTGASMHSPCQHSKARTQGTSTPNRSELRQ